MAWQIPVHPDHGEPIEIAPPRKWTKKQRAEIFAQRKGICGECRKKIRAGQKWHVGHYRTRALGGSNKLENQWPAHARCNLERAAKEETPAVAEAKRRERYHHTGRGRPRKGRPMIGGRGSKWTRRYNRKTKRWETKLR